jgi:DNA invertase Pin-like site-specific DNA recombinase
VLQDLGVSGFTGLHRSNPDRYALAAFLEAVSQGRIPKDSYFIVENLDRLSREHSRPAMLLFLGILAAR